MSRLQKARNLKRKKWFWARLALFFFFLALVATVSWHFFLSSSSTALIKEEEPLLIDPDRTTAFVDFLGITYINVSIVDDKAVDEVRAEGVALIYQPEHDQWRVRLGGYRKGDSITVTAIEKDGAVQEKVMILAD